MVNGAIDTVAVAEQRNGRSGGAVAALPLPDVHADLEQILAHLIHQKFPSITSLTPARQGFIYLDTTRNARGQALAAPYCARPWPGATVSAPLKWSEVRRTLDPGKFTIKQTDRP
jgi:bifunctional non-homologous end joining protein LigD